MEKLYTPHYIEQIVQQYWNKHRTFSITEDKNKEKYYCLSMIPYPSGNLHMGHVRNYTIGDVISRYQRMLGKNVLQPIGWDAFGLPAEQAAIENNKNPADWTHSNIKYMKNQLQSLGFSYDWTREIITCHPKYYKWEQWFFTILYKKGLVYRKTAVVNWCPYHKTVLANEQVINNSCWRCHTKVTYKKIPQWFIKITNYADQLLDGLNQLQYWPEEVKTMQRHWIGRSTGINVIFKIFNSIETITAYITRLDIFMGITYLTISIDHPISLKIAEINPELNKFIQSNNTIFNTKNSNNCIDFIKRGFFTKIYAIHPITYNKLPIWIANFVVPIESDGTGIIASCPAHNQQDWEFAHKYHLPIIPVIKYLNGDIPNIKTQAMTDHGILFNSNNFDKLTSDIASDMITKTLLDQGVATTKISYRLKDWGVSRQRYWGVPIPMIMLRNGTIEPVPMHQLPVLLPRKIYYSQANDNTLKKYSNWRQIIYKNQIAFRDTDTFDTFVESSWYYARYTCPHYNEGMLNPDSANYWLPIDQYIGGIEHATMHLMYFRFYHKLMRDVGLIHSDEPAIRLLCQGMILADSFYYLSNNKQKIWVSPINITVNRNTKGHIINAIDSNGKHLIYAGMCKMSKSKNNGIDPNVMIQKYGADAVRFFIMFAAPVRAALVWKETGIIGAQRFLKRIWDITYHHVQSGPANKIQINDLNDEQKLIRCKIHKTIIKVTDDIDRKQSFNTALSSIMKLVNALDYIITQVNIQNKSVLQEALLVIVRLLYPFTPHISFILWNALGNSNSIDSATWPIPDLQAMQYDKILIVIQVNGKTRKKIFFSLHSKKDVILETAKKEIFSNKSFINKQINKIIYIPNKIINFLIT